MLRSRGLAFPICLVVLLICSTLAAALETNSGEYKYSEVDLNSYEANFSAATEESARVLEKKKLSRILEKNTELKIEGEDNFQSPSIFLQYISRAIIMIRSFFSVSRAVPNITSDGCSLNVTKTDDVTWMFNLTGCKCHDMMGNFIIYEAAMELKNKADDGICGSFCLKNSFEDGRKERFGFLSLAPTLDTLNPDACGMEPSFGDCVEEWLRRKDVEAIKQSI